MASAGTKVAKAVPFSASDLASIKDNPYLHRVIEDDALRDNVYNVIESSKGAYERLASNGAPHKTVLEDNKLHGHVESAAASIRDIALALNDVDTKHNLPFKKKKKHGRKLLLVVVIGTIAALALSEGLRNKLLDALFGKEEEFQYTPPAPAPTEPPASPVSAA
jgi:hypothetical protein